MDAVVMGNHDTTPAHPWESPVEGGMINIHPPRSGAATADNNSLMAYRDNPGFIAVRRPNTLVRARLKARERHHRAIQTKEHFDRNFVQSLKVPYQLKMVARGAAGVLQRKNLVVIEDAHENSCYLVVHHYRISLPLDGAGPDPPIEPL